jgi:enoyl-CoA hydratase/carnithine racemase
MTYENLLVEREGAVAIVTINRPEKRNALNTLTLREIHHVMTALGADAAVGAIVLTGAGDKAFVAGADISELAVMTPAGGKDHSAAGQRAFDAIETLGTPVIAAVNGFALGGGCELAMACDYRIASEKAVFGQPEILLGIIPGGGGTQRLPRLVGPSRAKEMMITGRQVRVDEALRIGLADEVVAPEALMDRALALASSVAAGATQASRLVKRAVDEGIETDLASGLSLELELFEEVFRTDDARIGVRSFLENGPGKANFTGR